MEGLAIMSWVDRSRLPAAGFLILLSLASAPSGSERPAAGGSARLSTTAPAVLNVFPDRNELNVLTTTEIVAGFNQLMDQASFTAQSVRVVGERYGPYDLTISFSNSQNGTTASIFPTSPLAIGERITVVLTSQIQSLAQEAIVPHAWTFTTACQPGSISFSQDSSYFAARLPFEMSALDVDRNGYSDFAVVYTPSSAGSLGVFTNDADATLDFSPTTLFRTAPGPRGIHAGDFGGDAYPDIAMTTSADSSFLIFMNDQLGGFPDTTRYKTTILSYNLTGADLDLDGDMDLAMGNLQGPQILLAQNDGAGNFGNFVTIVADSSPRGIEASDLDDDGDLDLVAVNANGKVSVFENLGGGVFGSDTTYAVGFRPLSLYVNDLNGDGHPDVAVSNLQGGSISLLFNLGDGTLGPAGTVVVDSVNVGPGKNTLFEVYGNDFDGDGDIDLATANWFTGRLVVLQNNGLGQYTAVLSDSLGIGSQNIVGGDLDQDGDIDLVLSNWATGMIRILRNGSSEPSVVYEHPSPYGVDAPLQGEILAGFSTEMITSSFTDSNVFVTTSQRGRHVVSLLYDTPQRTLHATTLAPFFPGETVTFTVGPGIESVIGPSLVPHAWDFVAVTIPGGSQFTEMASVPLLLESSFLLPGTLDGGDDLDFMVVKREPGEVCKYLNAGGLAFVPGVPEEFGGRIIATVSGDFDGDSDSDLAIADDLGNTIRVILTEDAMLQNGSSATVTGTPTALGKADFNNDGWVDLLTGTTSPDEFGIWWNSAAGFGPTVSYSLSMAPRALEALDIDLDGDLDMAVLIDSPPGVRLYRALNNGLLSFNAFYAVGVVAPAGLAVGDLSGDGFPDLAVGDPQGSNIHLLLSLGNSLYSVAAPIAAASGCSGFALADLNGDEALDVVSIGPGAAEVRVLSGVGDGTFGQDSTFSLTAIPAALATGDFSSTGRQEILIGAGGQNLAFVLGNSPTTGVAGGTAPAVTRLHPARPNPANPLTEISFDLAAPARARLRVFNVEGALVRTLLDQALPAGRHFATWDGRERSGHAVASGLYVYRLDAGPFAASGKVIILR